MSERSPDGDACDGFPVSVGIPVRDLLSHGEGAVLLDGLTHLEPGVTARARWVPPTRGVWAAEPQLVLLEAWAQVASACWAAARETEAAQHPVIAGLRDVCLPPTIVGPLELVVTLERQRSGFAWWRLVALEGQAVVGKGLLVAGSVAAPRSP